MTNSLQNIPAAACQQCGGWASSGGMSQHSMSDVLVDGRTGCTCHRSKNRLPTPAESLACPEGLTAAGKRAWVATMAYLNRFATAEYPLNPGGCQTFYTRAAWAKRENLSLKGVVLVIVYDGGDVWDHLSYMSDFGSPADFAEHMSARGFRVEAFNNWSSAVYAD